ncbi:DUF6412 domain-containing protein [Microbacterium jejuense]|uniref:DUF6412 domain-containing protein n=1 Tax=Microbacterium jejuense TaxID=1263637 RepID=UPI0031E56428
MFDAIGTTLRALVEVLTAVLRPAIELIAAVARPLFETAPLTADAGALVLAATLVAALAVLAVAIALFRAPARTSSSGAHPHRAISDATRLTASHPDAPGHSRPRAPGLAAPAA